ncbi:MULTISPECIES: helix-turn-helix domain-containing protein [unclassified Paenibacillus]|uniref:helix-turn-helix domain-containing protein n=1 Tax=unclassified Paenibacillus TaxID=185978 RepID=UPI002F428BFF
MQPIGKIIKDLRTKRGLSLEELADKINQSYGTSINKGMISKWENGLGDPRLENVRQLALFFNVSLDQLIGMEQQRIDTIAAHHDGEDWTEEELEEIEAFKRFVKMKRKDS